MSYLDVKGPISGKRFSINISRLSMNFPEMRKVHSSHFACFTFKKGCAKTCTPDLCDVIKGVQKEPNRLFSGDLYRVSHARPPPLES